MTNYNERLDEVLFNLTDLSYASFTTQEEADRVADQLDYDRAEAKQAITSLIKELVADAKPGRQALFTGIISESYVSGKEHNQAIDEFEQNLLKELEEV